MAVLQLLRTAGGLHGDVEKLHAKVDRTKVTEAHNLASVQESSSHLMEKLEVMQSSLAQFTDGQLMFNSNLHSNIGTASNNSPLSVLACCYNVYCYSKCGSQETE